MLSPKQIKGLKEATKRINLFEGCVRSGKTFVANTLFLEQCYTIPYDKFLLTGKTKDTLKRNVTTDIIKMIGEDNCEYNAHMGELTYKVGRENRIIYCVGALDERAVGRIQGGTFGSWYADERVTHPEGFCEMARTRLSVPNSRMFWTCNPESPYHTIYKDYIQKREVRNDLYHLHFEIDDNPVLTEEYIEELKTTYTGVFFRRMVLGEWVLAEGIIYDMFSIHHIVPSIPPIKRFWVSSDYGTASVTVFLLFGLGEDNKIYVIKEWYHDAEASRYQMTDPELVQAMNKFTKDFEIWRVFPDPSATSFILALKKAGYAVIEADNDVLDGIRAVGSGFYNNELLIHESCKTLIPEISDSYVWDDKARLRGEDKPLKKNDHRSDTLRYGLHTYKLHSNTGTSSVIVRGVNVLKEHLESNREKTNDHVASKEDIHNGRFSWRRNRIPGGNNWLKRKRVQLR